MSLIKTKDILSRISLKKAKQAFELYLMIKKMVESENDSIFDGDQKLIGYGSQNGLSQQQTEELFQHIKEIVKLKQQNKPYLSH